MRDKELEAEIVDGMVLQTIDGIQSTILEPTLTRKYYLKEINDLAARITIWREKKGFVTESHNIAEKLMLIVTELSEALEEIRNPRSWQRGNYIYLKAGKPEGFPMELMDALIRLLDLCAALRIDIASGLDIKMDFNEGRPYMHDKNF